MSQAKEFALYFIVYFVGLILAGFATVLFFSMWI